MDIQDMETQRFSNEQRDYMVRAQATGILTNQTANAETEKTAAYQMDTINPFDAVARLNAFIKYTARVRCYITLQNRVYVQIREIQPTQDGQFWHCVLVGEDHEKGTVITIPGGGPLLIRID